MAHVLVAYASKRGSTAEIAEKVADVLGQAGLDVDLSDAGEVKSIDDYDAVVLGSAVYIKHWRGDASHFLRKHSSKLSEMPFWVFSSGPVGKPDEQPSPEWTEPPRIVKRVERLGVRSHVVFGGRLPLEPHGPIERAMVKNTPAELHDQRDWEQIRRWAEGIAADLMPVARAA